eukprot:sb/3466497/
MGDSSQTEKCTGEPCPINGNWNDWEDWTECTVTTCGSGVRSRSRKCDNPAPQYNGVSCSGSDIQYEECGTPCEDSESYTDWSEWGACNVTCGSGVQDRTRECTETDITCTDTLVETRVCNPGKECASIVNPPEDISVNTGETAVLECSVTNGKITWLKDGQQIVDEGRSREYTRSGWSRLQISQVQLTDQAEYTCHVTDSSASDSRTAKLTVYEVPVIQFSSEEQRVREGARVTLECVARGNPAPRVSIVKYEDLDVPSTPITMPQMSLGFEVRETLVIGYVREQDAGEYICTAQSPREREALILAVWRRHTPLDSQIESRQCAQMGSAAPDRILGK